MKAKKIVLRIVRISISLLIVVFILMLLVTLGRRAYAFGYRVFTETSVDEEPGKDVVVLIRSDMGKSDVAELLEEKGLVGDKWLFLVQYRLTGFDHIEPGTYTLNTAMTTHDLAETLAGSEEEATEDAAEDPAAGS